MYKEKLLNKLGGGGIIHFWGCCYPPQTVVNLTIPWPMRSYIVKPIGLAVREIFQYRQIGFKHILIVVLYESHRKKSLTWPKKRNAGNLQQQSILDLSACITPAKLFASPSIRKPAFQCVHSLKQKLKIAKKIFL